MNPNVTKVYLLNVPLESDLKNTLYFTSAANQQTYFQSRIQKSYTDFTYQRKDQFIRVPAQVDTLYNCNYVMYQNSAYSNKWFYAFITKMVYVDDGRTDVYIETDVMQTWMFDITIKSSFVEREHVNDDTVGLHTVPEQLETGEYILQATELTERQDLNFLGQNDTYMCVATTQRGLDSAIGGGNTNRYNNIYSGLYFLVFPTAQDIGDYIQYLDTQFSQSPIVAVFMIPEKLVTEVTGFHWSTYTEDGCDFQYADVIQTTAQQSLSLVYISKPDHLDADYIPRNNKLFCYPYRYMMINNNAGQSAVYNYEGFSDNTCYFGIEGAIGVGCSIQLYPTRYYESSEINYTNSEYSKGLVASKLPTCAWTNDAYTNWLTANAVNIGLGFASDVAQIGVGAVGVAAGGTGAGAIVSGVGGIASRVAQMYEYSKVPNTANGGVNNGDLAFARKESFTLYKKSIRKEYAQIIDEYFDMFGYKTNRVKVPNKAHRQRWWYTKTIDINIDGAVPNEDMQKIKNAYNSGITFWRNASEIQNYSLSNNIV